MKKYPHTFGAAGSHQFQITIRGRQIRSGCYRELVDAAFDCQLLKGYVGSFGFTFLPTMEAEEFTVLAHRRNVDIRDPQTMLAALPARVRDAVLAIEPELSAHRDSLPDETLSRKIRRYAGLPPGAEQWLKSLEQAEIDRDVFNSVNLEYVSRLLAALPARLNEALPPLERAASLLAKPAKENARLGALYSQLVEITALVKSQAELSQTFVDQFNVERDLVAQLPAALEASRPCLTK